MKVSVIIPAYNAEQYLAAAVDSVLATHYAPLEILIVEDHSQDGTRRVAEQIAQEHGGVVRLLSTPGVRNRGAGAARNTGIEQATGEIICFLDADAGYYPNRFDRALQRMQRDQTIDVIFGRSVIVYEAGVEREFGRFTDQYLDVHPGESLLDAVVHGCPHTNTVTVRRSALRQVGPFSTRLSLGQDHELFIRLAMISRTANLPDGPPIAFHRRHGSNRWRRSLEANELNWLRVVASADRWARAHPEMIKGPVPPFQRLAAEAVFGWCDQYLKRRDSRSSRRLLLELARRFPAALFSKRFFGNARNTVFIPARLSQAEN
jgi:glycosyltransferase involved in cell wall biosynthesis